MSKTAALLKQTNKDIKMFEAYLKSVKANKKKTNSTSKNIKKA